MAKSRSPNYPYLSLAQAIEALRPVFQKENRNKMAKLALAKHLGSNSLNGRVLARIGALRAYGLIEGTGDTIKVTDDGITLINAPVGSADRQAALMRCAFSPSVFKSLREEFPDLSSPPSEDNVRYSLIKLGYSEKAAGKAARSYRATVGLVAGIPALYDAPEDDTEDADEEVDVQNRADAAGAAASRTPPPPPPPPLKPSMRQAVFPLPEGDVTLIFPSSLSVDSASAMSQYIQLTLNQAKAQAAAAQPQKGTGGDSAE